MLVRVNSRTASINSHLPVFEWLKNFFFPGKGIVKLYHRQLKKEQFKNLLYKFYFIVTKISAEEYASEFFDISRL